MSAYREMKIDKSLYQRRGGFFRALEEMDPSADYRGTDLEKLTAFERQLKRFDIHVSGSASDPVEKFFRTSESAVLFPAYIGAAVEQGMPEPGYSLLHCGGKDRDRLDGLPLHPAHARCRRPHPGRCCRGRLPA